MQRTTPLRVFPRKSARPRAARALAATSRTMSDSLLKNLLSFVAGLAVAILIFVAGYRVLSPTLPAINGILWAAWAQVIAIAVAAGLAAVIAFGQLKALQQTLEFSTKTTKVK